MGSKRKSTLKQQQSFNSDATTLPNQPDWTYNSTHPGPSTGAEISQHGTGFHARECYLTVSLLFIFIFILFCLGTVTEHSTIV